MNTTSTISTTSEDNVSQHLRALADEAEALLKATANAGDQTYEAVRARLREEMQRMRERLSELEAAAAAQVKYAARVTDETVHQHPYAAMGLAALGGLLVGVVLARR